MGRRWDGAAPPDRAAGARLPLLAFGGSVLIALLVVILGRERSFAVLVLLASATTLLPGLVATIPSLAKAGRRSEGPSRALGLLMAGAVTGPALTAASWPLTHPVLHLDNAHEVPIDVWIDGVRWGTVGTTPADAEPPWLRLPAGTHRLAWSPVGSPVGLHELEVELLPGSDHLYAPGGAGCHWVTVASYGKASPRGYGHGPLPLAEFHQLGQVDVWFGDLPARVLAPWFSRGLVRVAVQRFEACAVLADRGCGTAEREEFVECVRAIDGHGVTFRGGEGRSEETDCFAAVAGRCRPSQATPAGPANP